MTVVVTGGAGFIGSHLCERLLAEGYEVLCVDNLLTGREHNVAHLDRDPRFEFLRHDITKAIEVPGPVDYVLHFASAASPVDYLSHPIQTLKAGALGTWVTLGLARAKGARFVLASTSEVYGDPQITPQSEEYWGYVNPVGPRGCYDEAKRFAEAMTMAYHRYHGVNTGITRIFNSILASETVLVFNDDTAHIQPIGEYVNSLETPLTVPRHVLVPAFNPQNCRMELRYADAVIKHAPQAKDAFLVRTRYGREIRVTGDHSVFRRNTMGCPEAVLVRELQVGDDIAIPGRLPVIEQDIHEINISEHLVRTRSSDNELWNYALSSPRLAPIIAAHKDLITDMLLKSPRFSTSKRKRNSVGCAWRKYRQQAMLPLAVVAFLQRHGVFQWPHDAWVRPHKGGGGVRIRNHVPVTNDLLWFLGLYLAEGCHVGTEHDHRLLLSSDGHLIRRAAVILEAHFGVRPRLVQGSARRAPSLYVDSKLLFRIFDQIFRILGKSHAARIPAWIFQLPLSRLKYFLEGYREGDGTHTRYLQKRELAFNTVSQGLATDLTLVLLRFGLVASVGRYQTTFKARYRDRTFPFFRVTICEVSDFNILSWDQSVRQRLNARRTGDLVWARVKEILPVEATDYVYDFSVSEYENFVAGNGVIAHNTFGPWMRPDDGRVIPTLLGQALSGEPLTVHGDGTQTRSFCYITDLVEGISRLMRSEIHDPVNLGNPEEIRIIELAQLILALTGSRSPLKHTPLPQDDPVRRCPDITRARTLLGWEPRVSLRDGLKRTLDWLTAQVGRPA